MSLPTLTTGELTALRGLQHKKNGHPTPFVNIRDARALTALGLAVRTQEGWDITREGVLRLSGDASNDPPAETASLLTSPSWSAPPQDLVMERWRYLRALLLEQLDGFESGTLQLHSQKTDLAPEAMTRLRNEIANFDALIAGAERSD